MPSCLSRKFSACYTTISTIGLQCRSVHLPSKQISLRRTSRIAEKAKQRTTIGDTVLHFSMIGSIVLGTLLQVCMSFLKHESSEDY